MNIIILHIFRRKRTESTQSRQNPGNPGKAAKLCNGNKEGEEGEVDIEYSQSLIVRNHIMKSTTCHITIVHTP